MPELKEGRGMVMPKMWTQKVPERLTRSDYVSLISCLQQTQMLWESSKWEWRGSVCGLCVLLYLVCIRLVFVCIPNLVSCAFLQGFQVLHCFMLL